MAASERVGSSLAFTESTPVLSAAKVLVGATCVERARKGVDDLGIVQTVIDFVQIAMRDGFFTRSELAPHALQVYHTAYYLDRVVEGGHALFIADARENFSNVCSDALAGLTAVGAPHAIILQNLMRSRDRDAELLQQLDGLFEQVNRHSNLIGLMARWIISWPELMIVPELQFPAALRELCASNPHLMQRKVRHGIHECVSQTEDRLHVGVNLALSFCDPPEILLGLGAPAPGAETADTQVLPLQTHRGTRKALVTSSHVRIRGERTGIMASVSSREIDKIIEAARKHQAGAAIRLLLWKSGSVPNFLRIAAIGMPTATRHGGETLRWRVACDQQILYVDTKASGAHLMHASDIAVLASCHMEEVSLFLKEFSADRVLSAGGATLN